MPKFSSVLVVIQGGCHEGRAWRDTIGREIV